MKHLFLILTFLICATAIGQKKAYGDGEWFRFRVHYGLVTAGYATLQVNETSLNGKQVYHVKGEGRTTGMTKWFFPVEDYYESYIDTDLDIPYRFIRKIDEGGYTKDIQIDFDHEINEARVINNKKKTQDFINFPEEVQDMVSAFYYLRNNLDISNLKVGETIDMNMFFDKENYKFRLKFLGRETLKTDFGKVPTLIFRPYVQSGRVFEEKESLTVWVTDDENKMPILIKASLVVGSLKATLTEFKGLQHSFKIIMN
ncbi:DUF3108 domain-containing protein [Aureitalea marina]|uniref:ATP-dependent exonuclease n=1 Tax=Aureitalea marina TaxID=930804 RepID=A0A2S7KSK6_9FLAO|nr:DUF3108 domain-containing protein [Aureitalea marina]PQB05611.1 ATP-dependent exonuclease [Aureitalea marina]